MNIDAPLAQVEKLVTEVKLLMTMRRKHFWLEKAQGLRFKGSGSDNMLVVDVRAVMFRSTWRENFQLFYCNDRRGDLNFV
jgi:hypothetical protein